MIRNSQVSIARFQSLGAFVTIIAAAFFFDNAPCRAEQLFKLTASDAKDADWFGYSGALNGNRAIVGAPTNSPATGRGAAYLFDTYTGQQLHQLVATDNQLDVRDFGNSVALNENFALVGARLASGVGQYSGAAYVFNPNTSQQVRRLTATDPHAYDFFGASVALSGNRVLVGAWGADNRSIGDAGSAYLFDVTTGQQLFKLTANDAAESDWLGYKVAMSGNRALVSAGQYNNGPATGPGSVYVFDVTTGQQLLKLSASDAKTGDYFGSSIAMLDDLAVIGSFSGAAYAFDLTTGKEISKIQVGSYFDSIAMSGDIALAGNKLFDVNTGQLLASVAGSPSGAILALNGDVALIGSHQDSVGRRPGAAYLFRVPAVPEPSTVILAALIVPLLIGQRRPKS